MEDEKTACNYGGLVKDLSKLKLEDAPARDRPYNLRTRKNKVAKENGMGYVSKQHKAMHRIKRDKKNQEIETKFSLLILSLKLAKMKVEDKESIVQEKAEAYRDEPRKKEVIHNPTHFISIKSESPPFDHILDPFDKSQQSSIEHPQYFKPLLFQQQPLHTLIPKVTHGTQADYPMDIKLEQDSNRIQNKNGKKSSTDKSTHQLDTHKPHRELYLPPFLRKKEVESEQDLFSLLETCRIAGETGCEFIMVKYNLTDRHLRLVPGLNILANCKNFDCTRHLESVICPRGLFPERKGYCPLDGELFNAICPSCKTSISPDDSFGFGFYNCDFQLTYKLHKQPKFITELKKKEGTFYFGKYKPLNDTLDIMQVRMSV